MHVISDEQLQTMLQSLPPDQQNVLGDIISRKIVSRVRCYSKSCKGRTIAVIYDNGNVAPSVSAVDEKDPEAEKLMWLRSSRKRLDGGIGFECWCGNDSRLSEEEKPHFDTLTGAPPSKEGLMQIYEQVNGRREKYPVRNGVREIDGFRIEVLA